MAGIEEIVGRDQFLEINKMSPNSKIAALRKISDQIPNSADLVILQTYIVNLMSDQRSSFDFAVPIPPPNAYDVLIQDINPTTLSVIGEELGVISLSQTSATPNFPVRGILFGQCQRAFVPFIVMKREISINVNFLYDIGSPNTHLRPETLAALGFQETPTETNVFIHGTAMTVYVSSNHFEIVDLLGQDFMVAIRGVVTIDYPCKIVDIRIK